MYIYIYIYIYIYTYTFNLIGDLWISNLLMDVGVSRTKVDARTYPLKQGSCVSSPPALRCNSLGPQRSLALDTWPSRCG